MVSDTCRVSLYGLPPGAYQMNRETIHLMEKFSRFSAFWSPRVVAEMNDYQFKAAKFMGELTWHDHKHTDGVFLVIEGEMGIEFRDKTVYLSAGEMCVVPRGEAHKPFAKEACKVLLVEPKGVINTGDAGGDLTAQNDVWI